MADRATGDEYGDLYWQPKEAPPWVYSGGASRGDRLRYQVQGEPATHWLCQNCWVAIPFGVDHGEHRGHGELVAITVANDLREEHAKLVEHHAKVHEDLLTLRRAAADVQRWQHTPDAHSAAVAWVKLKEVLRGIDG